MVRAVPTGCLESRVRAAPACSLHPAHPGRTSRAVETVDDARRAVPRAGARSPRHAAPAAGSVRARRHAVCGIGTRGGVPSPLVCGAGDAPPGSLRRPRFVPARGTPHRPTSSCSRHVGSSGTAHLHTPAAVGSPQAKGVFPSHHRTIARFFPFFKFFFLCFLFLRLCGASSHVVGMLCLLVARARGWLVRSGRWRPRQK